MNEITYKFVHRRGQFGINEKNETGNIKAFFTDMKYPVLHIFSQLIGYLLPLLDHPRFRNFSLKTH